MGGLIANEREKEGYELEQQLSAGLPMPVWRLDLEVERARPVTAAEATVLALVRSGLGDLGELAHAMGMGTDLRLPERVLVKLLGAGAVDTAGAGFVLTELGEQWRAVGTARGRERVSVEVRLDPVLDTLDWADQERPVFANHETWTIELSPVDDEHLLGRKVELGDLVRKAGLPDDDLRAPPERRPTVELRGLSIASRRTHWREVRVDLWRHPLHGDPQLIGYVGDAENPALTKLLARHEIRADQRRLTPRPT